MADRIDQLMDNSGLLTSQEVPPETPDNSEDEFSLKYIPADESMVEVFVSGVKKIYGSTKDFTIIRSGITRKVLFDTAPGSADTVEVLYQYLP